MMDLTQEFNVRRERERFVFAYVYVRGCAESSVVLHCIIL